MTTNQISKTGQSSNLPASRRIFLSGYLANISMAWKMGLMAFVLFLGTLGITATGYLGMQSLRYQLSNIYDFMLIPIVAINQADTALADTQFHLEQLHNKESTASEQAKAFQDIQSNETLAADVMTRYDTEWVTTASPEFTQALRDAGKLDLQGQEIAALESFHSSFDAYKAATAKYLAAVQTGNPDETLGHEAIEKLQLARTDLQTLIEINNQFADFSNSEAQAAFRQALLNGGIVLSIGLALGLLMSYLIVVSITRRLGDLTRSAAAMQAGNLEQAVSVTGRDEVSLLGSTFNTMAEQLKNLFSTLEDRVAERTSGLVLAAEVGRSVSQVGALDVLLKNAAEIIRSRFDLYYAQIYLTDASQTNLLLQAGTGSVGAELLGRGHRLPVNTTSINGRAATEKRSVVISDTAASASFRPNPLLPNTRSEMAVPLLIGDKVVGVLDMQSEKAGTLNEEILPAFEALAGQFAIAIQNANFLAETQQARAEVEAQARRLTRTNWADYLDAIHKPEETGFVFEQNKVTPITQEVQVKENALVEPISVTGEALGNLVVEMEGDSPIARTDELVNAVARQVAQHIENLRLLESAERYRLEAEEAARRITREGWQNYVTSRLETGLGYSYNLNEVKSLDHNTAALSEEPAASTPLKVRDEIVGQIAMVGLGANDEESINLVNAVADRLSAHLEGLRLTEQTEKRAYELEAVAAVSTTASSTLDPTQLLQSVVTLTKERFGLYHAHVYLLNNAVDTLELAAGAGEVGKQMVAAGWNIPLDHEESIVAKAARNRQSVIANDIVRDKDSQFLSNRLLPDTRSELAVPLIVGDTVLGVFDVQADTAGRFTEDDVRIQTTLAAQVSVAVQNARTFTQAQRQAERESTLNVIGQKIQSATSVESVLQIAARELGRALGAPLTIAQLGIKETIGNGH